MQTICNFLFFLRQQYSTDTKQTNYRLTLADPFAAPQASGAYFCTIVFLSIVAAFPEQEIARVKVFRNYETCSHKMILWLYNEVDRLQVHIMMLIVWD
jgi:hypothetical protein